MIRKQYRSDHQCLKLAFIEARMDAQGFYNNSDMTRIFGNHNKDAARIVRRYKELNPNSIRKQGISLIPENSYRRKILKANTNAWEFIAMLELLHGVPHADD